MTFTLFYRSGRVLTYIGYVQAVLLGGVVLGGSDGDHVHAVHVPHGGVPAVEVAAVRPSSFVIWTFLFGPIPANTRGERTRRCSFILNFPVT